MSRFTDNGHEECPETFQFTLDGELTKEQQAELAKQFPQCDYEPCPDQHFINGDRKDARRLAKWLFTIGFTGVWYDYDNLKDNGKPIMCNADGSRSVFCDLTDDMEDDQ